jgi:stage III sporulation protein AG
MWDKLKNDKYVKDLLVKLLTILFVAAIALLLFDVLTQSKDGRRQIVDMDGGTEYTEETLATSEEVRLENILSQMKGVGDSDVMITWKDEKVTDTLFMSENSNTSRKVEGVIVACEGAGDVVVKNNIINAVATVFDIPASNVMVFEKVRSSTK